MLAKELINRLERLGLLDQEIIEALREQLGQGSSRVTPEAIAKLLVDNGQLTRYQATKLIGELRSQESGESEGVEGAMTDDDDLGLAEDENVPVNAASPRDAVPGGAAPAGGAEPVVAEAVPVDAVAVEAVPVAEPFDNGLANGLGEPLPSSSTARRRAPVEQKSVWDSFKVYGYAGLIVILALAGAGLFYMINRGDADEFIQQANDLYQKEQYQPAQEQYGQFLDYFGEEHQYSSLARTRISLAALYRAADLDDPTRGLEVAKERLPEVQDEAYFSSERDNVAALLIDIADSIAAKAIDVSETAKKKALLDELDEQIGLTENPRYVSSEQRSRLASRLAAVMEARARVRRQIDRNLRLDQSVSDMDAALESKNTKQAYDIRFELLREFPELYDHPRLAELVSRASEIQETLVEPSAELPKVVDGALPADQVRSIVLTTLEGDTVPEVEGERMFLRAGGSVLAFAAEDGRLLWRRFVGYGQDHDPVRLDRGAAVLLSDASNLEVQRCSGESGEVSWRCLVDEAFSEPRSVDGDVFLSTARGRLISLDGETGDAKWVTQIPQPLEISPGVDPRASRGYQPGNHSNLYVMDTGNGGCVESFYLGHAQGTISVAPVPLLRHLFVIENATPDYSRVHVLRVNEEGEQIEIAQPDFRLTGNVKVQPIVMGRRLIVLTDRGQVAVYDVEPSAEGKKVTQIANMVASFSEPTPTQMAVGRNRMWVTGSRMGSYELQISTGRIVPDWSKYPGDRFIGEPIAFDEAVLSARVLRDSSAIRVTATAPESGAELWSTDVGVPVAMITPIEDKKGFHAVTTQGALFELDAASFSSGSTKSPIENPGDDGVALRFENPIAVDDFRRVLLNQATAGQALVYDPTRRREKLRKLELHVRGGKQTGDALMAGGGLFVPLASGRAVLMDIQDGSMLGSPFQPASDPTATVEWTTPIPLPNDPNQVVIGDSRNRLYRIRVGDQMRELSSIELEQSFIGPAAGVGNTMVATVAGPSADTLVGHSLASLDQTFSKRLDRRVTDGPFPGGGLALIRTDDGKLLAFGPEGEQKFTHTLPSGELVGKPVEADGKLIFAGRNGWIVALDATSGEEHASIDLGQPISAAPLPVRGGRLLVPGLEGLIYFAEL